MLYKCCNCGFVWAGEDISKEEMQNIYGKDYFFGKEYFDYLKESKAFLKNFERNIKIIRRFTPSGSLLEIGCAYGFFLDLARKYFSVTGIDISLPACKYAKENLGVSVVAGDFLEAEFKELSYDVIVAWATIEHLNNPHLYIEKASRLLKKGGLFACSTIDIDTFLPRLQKRFWRQIHPPTHLSYFSKKTLFLLLNKHGLKPIYFKHMGEYRSIIYLRTIFGKIPLVLSIFERYCLYRSYIYYNLFDTIYVFALKVNR